MRMTINEFIKGKFGVICQTKNEYENFLKALQKKGIVWSNGDYLMQHLEYFEGNEKTGLDLSCNKYGRLTRGNLASRIICYSNLSTEVFELYSLEIKQKNRKVSAILCDEVGNYVKHGTAKCHREDEFDFETGKKIALQRLFDIDAKKDENKNTLMLLDDFYNKFGIVGRETKVEALGHIMLKVGDVVELFCEGKSDGLYSVCSDCGCPDGFVMSVASINFINGLGKSRYGKDYMIVKRKSYTDMKHGDRVGNICYV